MNRPSGRLRGEKGGRNGCGVVWMSALQRADDKMREKGNGEEKWDVWEKCKLYSILLPLWNGFMIRMSK